MRPPPPPLAPYRVPRFASRAKRVVNNAVVNEVLSDAAVLKRQAREIEELKKRLGGGTTSHEVRGEGLREWWQGIGIEMQMMHGGARGLMGSAL